MRSWGYKHVCKEDLVPARQNKSLMLTTSIEGILTYLLQSLFEICREEQNIRVELLKMRTKGVDKCHEGDGLHED